MKTVFLRRTKSKKITMQTKLWKMILIVSFPLMIVIIVIASIGIGYALQYKAILNNVTMASEFNQDFKDDVDLKMYYYVIDSQYSEGLPPHGSPDRRGDSAEADRDNDEKGKPSCHHSVLNLCHNLQDKMNEIAETKEYNSREEQLINNIYILTDLIQEYMYTYLYYEAAHLDALQTSMIWNMIAFMAMIVILAGVLLFFLLRKSRKLSSRIIDPIDKICGRLEAIGKGDLLVYDPIQADVEEVQRLTDGIETMVGQLKRLIDKTKEQEKQRRRTELALLQAQINPHFLYNTLDTIIWLIESGDLERGQHGQRPVQLLPVL